LALLCLLISLLWLYLLGAVVQIRLHLVVSHSISYYPSPLDRHWPELGGGICGKTVLEAGA
jgi:hypothetical protein